MPMETQNWRLAHPALLEDRVSPSTGWIIRYAEAVDSRDSGLLASCFTDDAEVSFAGNTVPGRGGQAVVDFLGSLSGTPQRTGKPMVTSHLFINVVIDLDGDEADVRSTASVYSVRGEPEHFDAHPRHHVCYDRVRRTTDGWRIARKGARAAMGGTWPSTWS